MKVSSTPVYSSPALQSPSEHASTTTQASSYDATLGLSLLFSLTEKGCQMLSQGDNLLSYIDPSSVRSYPNGNFKTGLLVQPYRIKLETLGNISVTLKAGTAIELYPNGTLKGFVSENEVDFGSGLVAQAGHIIYLSESGQLSLLYLAKDFTCYYENQIPLTFKANSPLGFHDNITTDNDFGYISQGTLAESVQFENFFLIPDTTLFFNEIGSLNRFYSQTPIYYHSLFFKSGEYEVTMAGYIKKGVIHQTSVYNNVVYEEGTVFEYNKVNEVTRINGIPVQ